MNPTTDPIRRGTVHVRDWRTGQGISIRPDGTRTVAWAIGLVIAIQRARAADSY